jgi:hypothetical protein
MNIGPAIILIIVAAIAGYALGIIDSRITASLRKKTEEKSAPLAIETSTTELNRLGEHIALMVTIDKALKWHLELDGVRIEDINAINSEQRQRLVNIIVQMRPWLDGTTPTQTAAPVIAAPPPTPELPPTKPLNALPPAQPAPAASKAPLKIDPLRGFRCLLNNDIKAPGEQKNLSIVAMIDEVLQAKLVGTSLMNRAIRLEDSPQGEVIVCVDAQRYMGVDAVPESEIRDIIKAAIAEWGQK